MPQLQSNILSGSILQTCTCCVVRVVRVVREVIGRYANCSRNSVTLSHSARVLNGIMDRDHTSKHRECTRNLILRRLLSVVMYYCVLCVFILGNFDPHTPTPTPTLVHILVYSVLSLCRRAAFLSVCVCARSRAKAVCGKQGWAGEVEGRGRRGCACSGVQRVRP